MGTSVKSLTGAMAHTVQIPHRAVYAPTALLAPPDLTASTSLGALAALATPVSLTGLTSMCAFAALTALTALSATTALTALTDRAVMAAPCARPVLSWKR